ncbi:MAG: hypothetical protein RR395_07840 [Ruthenibacterium sp.]
MLPRPNREVLFKTTRMDFVDLYRSLSVLGEQEGLVQVYDLFEANNTAYAVRDADEGTPLLAYLQRRHTLLTQDEAIELLRPIIYGVEAMHRRGLLHRGISPETIFIGNDGRTRLSGYATLGLRTADSEAALVQKAAAYGVHLNGLSAYYAADTAAACPPRTVVLGYAGLSETQITQAVAALKLAWECKKDD